MVAVCIEKLLEILVGLHESLSILEGVLWVHVVVGGTVADKQCTMKFVGTRDGAISITLGILLRSAHVAFGVDRIVITIACRRSDRHTCLEDGTALAHAHQRAIATIRPTPDTDVVLIDIRQ